MSGHSRWSTIKRKKALTDSKRGKMFTKLIKEITVAARMGGGNADANPRLRTALLTARGQNMPMDNIDRAIKRGTGELEGVVYDEISYEGYGPKGVAIIVDSMTDNRIRTVAEIRNIFLKGGGHMGELGSVSWNFETKGYIVINKSKVPEDKLMEIALDAGAEDVRDGGTNFEVITDPHHFEAVKKKLELTKIEPVVAEISKLPKTVVHLEGEDAEKMMRLVENLEDNDDVQHVYSNSEISEEVLSRLG